MPLAQRVVPPFRALSLWASPSPRAKRTPGGPRKGARPPPKPKTPSLAARLKSLQTRPKPARKTRAQTHGSAQSGLVWRTDWGEDELAPPRHSPPAPRPKKEIVPVGASSAARPVPPHRIPYVRRTQGYISDQDRACTSVLRDAEPLSETRYKPIAQLAHGLDRVLFNPGVYWLRDPRSRIYNFTPWLESIPPVTDFAFDRITGFVKSSMDHDLWKFAKQHKRPFAGSTSSLTGLLSHCYFLISGDKEVDTHTLSRAFLNQATDFTPSQRMPTSVVLHHKEGVWLVDSDKLDELADKNLLTWMGTMLEKFLTLPEKEFKKLLRSSPVAEERPDTRREAYRYALSDRFVMRSQLDCVDPRLPGTGVFDIKTRAAVSIRLDILNYEENSGYLIKTLTGPLESFEKEYYDLIRSAFLKYSFQARIGNMDGVLVAYHNTARIFGFQYVPLEEMEGRLYGSGNGARIFNKCVLLLERILGDAVSIYGDRSVSCTFETRERTQELNVWVQPIEWDEQVEGRPCPITELNVQVVSILNGKEVRSARAVADGRGWVVHWTLTESALDEDEIRRRREDARERQLTALNFPAGIDTIEAMEEAWAKMDFGGKQRVAVPSSSPAPLFVHRDRETAATGEGSETGPVDDATHDRRTALRSPHVSFRSPCQVVEQLRQLALQGRQETIKEEAEGREKVVWGSVDGGWDRADDGLGEGSGTLPDGEEREWVRLGGVALGDGEEVGVVEGRSGREQHGNTS